MKGIRARRPRGVCSQLIINVRTVFTPTHFYYSDLLSTCVARVGLRRGKTPAKPPHRELLFIGISTEVDVGGAWGVSLCTRHQGATASPRAMSSFPNTWPRTSSSIDLFCLVLGLVLFLNDMLWDFVNIMLTFFFKYIRECLFVVVRNTGLIRVLETMD